MRDIIPNSLNYLKDNWATGIVGTGDAALMLDINFNTFSTRLKRDQALALRHEPAGVGRATVSLTGYHLVHNLLADRLMRYGFSPELAKEQAIWVREHILAGEMFTETILRFMKNVNGQVVFHRYELGEVEATTGDAATIIPIGTMVVRLAVKLFVHDIRDPRERVTRQLAANLALEMPKES